MKACRIQARRGRKCHEGVQDTGPARQEIPRQARQDKRILREGAGQEAPAQGPKDTDMTIEVDRISKSYDGKPVLTDFSLDISQGSSYLITGASGAGKTTLLRIILGLEQPDSGRVRLLGDYKYSRVNAGVVFQEDRLCPDFSAVQNVAMVSRRCSERIAREELEHLLPADELDKPVRELSGGMRRRVCIVRACIIPSDVLIMDEPFAGLDADNRKKCIDYIRANQGSEPLVITAHSAEGLAFCKTIPVRGHE